MKLYLFYHFPVNDPYERVSTIEAQSLEKALKAFKREKGKAKINLIFEQVIQNDQKDMNKGI